MSEFWILMAGILVGVLVLMVGILIDRDPEQTVGGALAEGSRWGAWFLLVFGGQALALNGL